MTRINIGILPFELCDQHLVAEYRELPRMVPFAEARWARHQGAGPQLPTLGTGHMAFFLPYGRWLELRWLDLCTEMRRRAFAPTLDWRPYPPGLAGDLADGIELCGRPALQARIRERLAGMRRATWTASVRPAWA